MTSDRLTDLEAPTGRKGSEELLLEPTTETNNRPPKRGCDWNFVYSEVV
jgi:hypothetical protein